MEEFKPTENQIKMSYQESITDNVMKLLGIISKDNDYFNVLYDNNGKEMGWEDYDVYNLIEPCECNDCGNVEAVMIFGDGTIEMILSDDDEPMCWNYLSVEDLSNLSFQLKMEYADFVEKTFGI